MADVIRENIQGILGALPEEVELVLAVKSRSIKEIEHAIDAGAGIIGENYVQEAEAAFRIIGRKVKWHFIGHLQRNKVKNAVGIFDMIETVDSLAIAREIDEICKKEHKTMPILIEINSGREKQKFGFFPEHALDLIKELSRLENISIKGLMTMGLYSGDPEQARPYFRETRKVFEKIKALNLQGVEMTYLSMGMSNSYHVAIEEGANMVRIGSQIFGPREK